MGDVLCSDRRMENIPGLEHRRKFLAVLFVAHFDTAMEHRKYLFAIVDMPLIGLVCPMEPGRNAVHIGNIGNGVPMARHGKDF